MTSAPLLTIRRLRITVAHRPVIRDLQLDIFPGERVAFIAPASSGKSLLAQALTGILPAAVVCSGWMRLNGYDIAQRHPALRPSAARVSMVDAHTLDALSPFHTVGQQLMIVCAGAGQIGCHVRRSAAAILKRVGLSPAVMAHYPASLNAGQRQRLSIGLALACNTGLLVIDEPVASDDYFGWQHVRQALRTVSMAKEVAVSRHVSPIDMPDLYDLDGADKAMLYVGKDLGRVCSLCERAIIFHQGQIVENASMQTLLSSPHHPYTQRLVADLGRSRTESGVPHCFP